MSAPAAISGDFATYKHVQGRKIMQLVIEVPAEMASAVFAALGTPGSGEAIPVALARLNTSPEPIAKPEAAKERRPFSELPYAQQAAMRCGEFGFQEYLVSRCDADAVQMKQLGDKCAAAMVRLICGVESRADLDKNSVAASHWKALDNAYFAWSRGMR
jgi:hypothetical protein